MKRIALILLAALMAFSIIACTGEPVQPAVLTQPTEDPAIALATAVPTAEPTQAPTPEPTTEPTAEPTETPTPEPTDTPEPTEEPTPEPTAEPETETATARVGDLGAVVRLYARGEEVEVVEEEDGYYIVQDAEYGRVWIDSDFIRMADEAAFKPYTGYATGNVQVFIDPYGEEKVVTTVGKNKKLSVIDEMGYLLLVETEKGQQGYVTRDDVSKTKLSSGGSSSGGSSSGQDGGDIALSMRVYAKYQFRPGKGTVLADTVEGYAAVFNYGEEVRVVEHGKEDCIVLAGNTTGIIPTKYLRFAGDREFKAWSGYAKKNAPFFGTARLIDEPDLLKVNTSVLVVDEIGSVRVVEVNKTIGYMPKDYVSQKKISTGGSGSSSGGEWTQPVL